MAKKKPTDFVVRMDGLSLSKSQKARLAGEINATVMRELGQIKFRGGISTRIPREWLGIWVDFDRAGLGRVIERTARPGGR